jgi:hypothetical protein
MLDFIVHHNENKSTCDFVNRTANSIHLFEFLRKKTGFDRTILVYITI